MKPPPQPRSPEEELFRDALTRTADTLSPLPDLVPDAVREGRRRRARSRGLAVAGAFVAVTSVTLGVALLGPLVRPAPGTDPGAPAPGPSITRPAPPPSPDLTEPVTGMPTPSSPPSPTSPPPSSPTLSSTSSPRPAPTPSATSSPSPTPSFTGATR
ncbi:hypothetical protein ACPEIF_15250 [Streptomyces sp. NPDC012600]|uniref:hypothetical protein n=1 Tax=Streptomyces sp. NPDC012600 TaxID=3415005 RepID=UPI003C2AE95F